MLSKKSWEVESYHFFQWRRFNFFEFIKEADGGSLDQLFKVTMNVLSIIQFALTKTQLFILF